MFETTCVHLIASFLQTCTDGKLLVCHERIKEGKIPKHARLLEYHLDESEFLKSWLAANRDIIPPSLGGAARKCRCPQPGPRQLGHKPGCAWGWFNRNASRWFRKIASLHYAQSLPGYDALVWLDSDCYFKRRLPSARIDAWFGEAAVFFHKSPNREVVESGVIGFRMNPGGRRFLRLTMDRYRSGRFRKHLRWDDGFQFQLTLNQHPEIPSVDLATHATKTFVLPHSPAGAYIEHYKGIHALLRLMR